MNLLKTLAVTAVFCSATASSTELVDINTASAKALAAAISGVGEARAAGIVTHRTRFGSFKSVDDLVLVKGIGQTIIEDNRGKLTVSSD